MLKVLIVIIQKNIFDFEMVSVPKFSKQNFFLSLD